MLRHHLPGWLRCFILVVVAFLLLNIPLLGGGLLIFAAPLWPVVLVNMGFVLLGRDALEGRAPRFLLALPVAWFGGYLLLTALSHYRADAFLASAAERNGARVLPGSAPTARLMIEEDDETRYDKGGLTSTALLYRHGLSAVLVRTPTWKGGSKSYRTRLVTLEQGRCPTVGPPDPFSDQSASYETVVIPDPDPKRYWRADGLCLASRSAEPDARAVSVAPAGFTRLEPFLFEAQLRRLTIARPTPATPLIAEAVRVFPLSWLPMPVFDCLVPGSGVDRGCSVAFLHDDGYRPLDQAPVTVAAKVLGLPTVDLRTRFPGAGWRQLASGRP